MTLLPSLKNKMHNIKDNEKVMNEKCKCECKKNPRILKHFEKCEVCGSTAYHSTPRELNPIPSEDGK